jgi:tRNA (mo5U34)-methyltransferase
LATDSYCWSSQSPTSKAGFELARAALGLEVEDRFIDVMDISPEAVGMHDVVLLLGVVYHLRNPITALERAASVTKRLLIVETETALNHRRSPAARLYCRDELNGDDTNWWAFNEAAVTGLLSRWGLEATVFSKLSPLYRLRRSGLRRWRPGRHRQIMTMLRSQRTVFHATRAI